MNFINNNIKITSWFVAFLMKQNKIETIKKIKCNSTEEMQTKKSGNLK